MAGKSKLTVKQERFAHLYLALGNASEAYRQSYDVKPTTRQETVHQMACMLLLNPNVAKRVKELQYIMNQAEEVTLKSLSNHLSSSRSLATVEGQHSAAISATVAQAKLHGFLTDKADITSGGKPLNEVSELDIAKAKLFMERVRAESGVNTKEEKREETMQ